MNKDLKEKCVVPGSLSSLINYHLISQELQHLDYGLLLFFSFLFLLCRNINTR